MHILLYDSMILWLYDYMIIYMNIYIYTYIHMYIYIYTYTYMYTYHISIYIYTYIYISYIQHTTAHVHPEAPHGHLQIVAGPWPTCPVPGSHRRIDLSTPHLVHRHRFTSGDVLENGCLLWFSYGQRKLVRKNCTLKHIPSTVMIKVKFLEKHVRTNGIKMGDIWANLG